MVGENMSETENDILIANDIIGLLDKRLVNKVTNIKKTLDHNEISEFYNISDFCVPMRFHAALFSIYHKVPFLPIFTTRKIKTFLNICYLYLVSVDCWQILFLLFCFY